MKMKVTLIAAALVLSACNDSNRYPPVPGVAGQAPTQAPVVVQQDSGNSMLTGLLGAGAGYMLGRSHSAPAATQAVPVTQVVERRTTVVNNHYYGDKKTSASAVASAPTPAVVSPVAAKPASPTPSYKPTTNYPSVYSKPAAPNFSKPASYGGAASYGGSRSSYSGKR